MTVEDVLARVQALAEEFAADRVRRQSAPGLSAEDTAALAETGFHRLLVPRRFGGFWESARRSTRPVAEAISVLAAGDSSLALILAMEPVALYLAGWIADVGEDVADDEWRAQRERYFKGLVENGECWGVLLSERGGGVRTTATPNPDGTWSLVGEKTSGSGWNLVSFMLTVAIPEGESEPEAFVLDLRDKENLDGVRITRSWDGSGMTSSSSHAIRLEGMRAERVGWPDRVGYVTGGLCDPIAASRLAPFAGIVRAALVEAQRRIAAKGGVRGAFERVEWARAQADAWLVGEAFEGILRATEQSGSTAEFDRQAKLAKLAMSELADTAVHRITRALGASAYSRDSPFGWWQADVRALPLIRPSLASTVDGLDGEAAA